MTLKSIILFVCLSFLSFCNLSVLAEESLADVVRARAENSKTLAQNVHSTEEIPEYSESKKNEIEYKLGGIQADNKADNLRVQGEQERNRKVYSNPDGITATMAAATDISRVTGDNCPGCDNLAEHDLFIRTDKLLKDPVSQFELLKGEGCKEIEEKKRKGFYRTESVEEITDKIEELRICESPVLQFNNCQKTLSVKCKQVIPCDYGGITKGSVSEGITFDANNGFLTIGTYGDNYLKGECATFNSKVSFYLANADLITVFRLIHVKFDDYIEIKCNGHIIYVGPDGGEYVEVKNQEVVEDVERDFQIPIYGKKGIKGYRTIKKKIKEKVSRKAVYNGSKYGKCERGTEWDSESILPRVNVNLKPYLKDGENTIEMKIIVGGEGEGWLRIEAKQQCCAPGDWVSVWEEECD